MKSIKMSVRRRCVNSIVPAFKLNLGDNLFTPKSQVIPSTPLTSPLCGMLFKTPESYIFTKICDQNSGPLFPTTPITPIINFNLMDEILSNLWLGGIVTETFIIDNGFTHVLSIYDKQPSFLNSEYFSTKWINIEDNGSENIADYFDECTEYIHNLLLSGGKIYVHCQMGISRSPTIIIAYIMRYGTHIEQQKKYSFYEALDYVSEKRPNICPNLGFNIALREYENKI
jgi:hypothetical protein